MREGGGGGGGGGHKGCLRLWIQITINLSYAPSWPAIIISTLLTAPIGVAGMGLDYVSHQTNFSLLHNGTTVCTI